MRFAPLFIVATLVPLLARCQLSKSCTAMGCTDGASLVVDFAPPPTSARGVRFTLCRNDTCATAASDNGVPDGAPAVIDLPLPSMFVQECGRIPWQVLPDSTCSYQLGADGRVHVTAFVGAPADAAHTTLHDGDVYRLLVTTDAGAVVADAKLATSYTKNQPNGADCDGAYYCQNASLKASL